MKLFLKQSIVFLFIIVGSTCSFAASIRLIQFSAGVTNAERFQYALGHLDVLSDGSFVKEEGKETINKFSDHDIIVGLHSGNNWEKWIPQELIRKLNKSESFLVYRKGPRSPLFVIGKDETGLLYACKEVVTHNLQKSKTIALFDAPEMVLRGTCIGMQKTAYLPGRDVYEYPYTTDLFPWFYDKKLWTRYLDMLVENRYNTLYLWNGHPFSSLVKLKDYPYALEVDEETFVKNEEIYRFLTEEANKRGIWVIQMFYNIILPKPFADKHGLKTQERNRVITPLISDYTRQSIAAFVEKYPNVGLLITLGEAMEGVGQDDINWFTQTILPGVKDGLARIHSDVEPPVILRAHDTDAPAVMKAALPHYKNLYTMAKYNGEALTTYTPRGKWAELHQNLGKIGTVHIQNVHILANLEPFRYASPDFIQKSVKAMHDVHLSNGLHIYPQASYWDWPYAADKVDGGLLQLDRDWMWYKAWARYAWKVAYTKSEEEVYWSNSLAAYYGLEKKESIALLRALEEVGEISPKILRRFGITDGNRQTSSLGMLMTQLINPYRYGLFTLLYESEAPEGEMIVDYAEKEAKGENHVGETPLQVANEIVAHGDRAVELIASIGQGTKNKAELKRVLQDIYMHQALAEHYSTKVKAALQVLTYKYTRDIADLRAAIPNLEASVKAYQVLADLTKDTYRYANSMQTKQRKIPMRGVDATFKHWTELLPVYEAELTNFKKAIDSLSMLSKPVEKENKKMQSAAVRLSADATFVVLKKGAKLYKDQELVVTHLPETLEGLQAVQVNSERQKIEGTSLQFNSNQPVKVLVGYFNSEDKVFAPKPVLEIDASANDYGQADAKVRNALRIQYMPMLDIHTYSFAAGDQTLKLPKGEAVILGFVSDQELSNPYNADVDNQGDDLDDLFGYYGETKL
ncbi:alpha-d-galacturonidase [Sphingobacterium sp. LRF_L2]|uniref:alpha-d-galacturonidase n=1 Tax=Sphingobacterium sp. LRF_L2 TaxID=3369421 RepID=UPI003F60CC07